MDEFYTLQECFEQAGKKFPFTIEYHIIDHATSNIPQNDFLISKIFDINPSTKSWISDNKTFHGLNKQFKLSKSFYFDNDISSLLDEK